VPEKVSTEEFSLDGPDLIAKVRELIREGNIRRIVVKQDDKTVFELPLTLAAFGVVVAPQLAALGAIVALATKAKTSIVVERIIQEESTSAPDTGPVA